MDEGIHGQPNDAELPPTAEEVRVLGEKMELLIERVRTERAKGDGEAHLHLMLGLSNVLMHLRPNGRFAKDLEERSWYESARKASSLLERYFNMLDKYPEQADIFRNQPISAYPYLQAMMITRDVTKGDKSEKEAWIDEMERRLAEDGKL